MFAGPQEITARFLLARNCTRSSKPLLLTKRTSTIW